MVASRTDKRNDSRWPEFLAKCAVRCLRHVAELESKSRLTFIARWHVALFTALAFGFAIVQSFEPQLHGLGIAQLQPNQSLVQSHIDDLQSDVATLLSDIAQLQSYFSSLQPQLLLQSLVALLLADKSQISGNEPRLWPGFLFANKSLFAHKSLVFTNQPILLTDKSELQSLIAELPITDCDTVLQPFVAQLHADDAVVFTELATIFNSLLSKLAKLFAFVDKIFAEFAKLLAHESIALRIASIHTDKPAELLLARITNLSELTRSWIQPDLLPKLKIFTVVARLLSHFSDIF